jgi:hypothetical protein
MQYRWLSLSGWVVAAVVLAFGGARLAASQTRFPDGAFVTAADGSTWAVSNGAKVRLTFTTDDVNSLAELRDAGTAMTLAEAQAVLTSGAPSPTAPSPNPAQTLIGQSVNTCRSGTRFGVAVVDAFWVKSVGGSAASGSAMWAVAIVDVTNTTTETSIQPELTSVKVKDERGREFEYEHWGVSDVPDRAAAEYGVERPSNTYRPGIAVHTFVAFQVPGDVQQLTLLPSPGGPSCGGSS